MCGYLSHLLLLSNRMTCNFPLETPNSKIGVFLSALSGLCESTDRVEVPTLLSQCLKEADSVRQCALLKKVSLLQLLLHKMLKPAHYFQFIFQWLNYFHWLFIFYNFQAGIALQEESCAKLPSHNICSCLAVLAELFVACDIKNPSRKIISRYFRLNIVMYLLNWQ